MASPDHLFSSWREFRCGKRGRQDVQDFERHLERHVFRLRDDLARGTYRHGPYERFHVYDPKPRVIHKATVRDRLVHHAVVRVLQPTLERSFIHDSYSCRCGKGPHAAVRRLDVFSRRVSRNGTRPCWTLKFDIAKFFDSVDHEILLSLLAEQVPCRRTRALLAEIVGSYSVSGTASVGRNSVSFPERRTGLPIGSVTSQLFANLYLDALDHYIKEQLRVRYYLRYTDDLLVLHNSPAVLRDVLRVVRTWVWEERRLTLHPRKVSIRKLTHGVDFLGYVVLPRHKVLRTRTRRRMFRRVNAPNLSSYLGLLGHCAGRTLRTRLVRLVRAQAALPTSASSKVLLSP